MKNAIKKITEFFEKPIVAKRIRYVISLLLNLACLVYTCVLGKKILSLVTSGTQDSDWSFFGTHIKYFFRAEKQVTVQVEIALLVVLFTAIVLYFTASSIVCLFNLFDKPVPNLEVLDAFFLHSLIFAMSVTAIFLPIKSQLKYLILALFIAYYAVTSLRRISARFDAISKNVSAFFLLAGLVLLSVFLTHELPGGLMFFFYVSCGFIGISSMFYPYRVLKYKRTVEYSWIDSYEISRIFMFLGLISTYVFLYGIV